jgi:hypothetical protein
VTSSAISRGGGEFRKANGRGERTDDPLCEA